MENQREKICKRIIEHCGTYPKLQVRDLFKYLFQSAFGCEHLMSDEKTALEYIKREYESIKKDIAPCSEDLAGDYSRVHLSCLNAGLKPETLAKLFCLSAKREPNGQDLLDQMTEIAEELIGNGALPLNIADFKSELEVWKNSGYTAIRHSDVFREAYRPAYRVIANRYAKFLQVLTAIDKLYCEENLIVAVEGGSASGKTTLSNIICEVYDCNVFHMDDFFLRPEQRTPQRFAEAGGNIDRERFFGEVLTPLLKSEPVVYRAFDCRTQTLTDPITVAPKKLTVIEGVYSLHPAFGEYCGYSVFLDIDSKLQKERILKRNTGEFAKRFFDEWIPLENRYFEEMGIKSRCSETVTVK